MTYFNTMRANNQFRAQHVQDRRTLRPPAQQVTVNQFVLQQPTLHPMGPMMGPPPPRGNNFAAFLGAFTGSIAGELISGSVNKTDQSQMDDAQKLNNLKTLFPNNPVVSNGGGSFTIKKDDGSTVTGSYEDILNAMQKKQGAEKPDTPKADAPKADEPKPDTPKADAPKADEPKPDVPNYPNAINASDAGALKGKSLIVNDEGYANSNFGTTVLDLKYKDGADKTKDFPQTLTLRTAGGKQLTMTFSKMDGNEAIYTSKGQEYRLESGASGPTLTQKTGDAGYGAVNYHRTEL